jgi:Ca2+-binding RTX toxin-like protein
MPTGSCCEQEEKLMALVVTQTHNYTGETLLDIDEILFSTSGTTTATFASNQFGPGLISSKVEITGDGFTNNIRVNLSSAGTFSAAGWLFSNWTANDRVTIVGTTGADTITGTASNDTIVGGTSADNLSGGGGNDTFVFSAGDVVVGEVIDGGTETTSDQIQVATAGNYNFSFVTVRDIEFLNLVNSGITATFNGSQLGGGGITFVSGTVDVFTQAIIVNGSVVDLSGVTFAGWGGVNQTISINGTNAASNSLIGSSQRDTISGTGNSADTITGGGGADTLNGGGGADTFRYLASTDVVTGETVNGGGGSDELELFHSGEIDFRPITLNSIEQLDFEGGFSSQRALFSSAQFGGNGIANNLAVQGDGGFALITITMPAAGAFSAAGWTFNNWNPLNDQIQIFGTNGVDTITGSSQRDIIEGRDGADNLSGGAGDDLFMIRAGDFAAGESINGGSHVTHDTITLTANANLSLGTIVGIERLALADAVSTTLTGDQIGSSDSDAILEVNGAGATATVQSVTVNATAATGFSVNLSGVLFGGWGGANQTITINGSNVNANNLIGSAQRDTIDGGDSVSNTITGGGGADTLTGGNINDVFRYVASSDTAAGESIDGGGGTLDTLQVDGAFNVFDFRSVNIARIEQLSFTSSETAHFTGSQIGAAAGAITSIVGGSAGCTIRVDGPTADLTPLVFASWNGASRVVLNGTAGVDTLIGSSQGDFFASTAGADTLRGGDGDDVFVCFPTFIQAGETFDGGDNFDTLTVIGTTNNDFSSTTIIDVERLGYGFAGVDGIGPTATLAGTQIGAGEGTIARIDGFVGSDTLIVQGAFVDLSTVTFVSWTAGQDTIAINGTADADILFGSSQNDRIDGGSGGIDTMIGAGGNDVYIVDNINDQVIEAFGQGTNDRVQTTTTYALAAGSEVEVLETNDANGTVLMDLVGNEFDNTIVGNAATNVLVGGRGLDTLFGGGGADIYVWAAMNEMGAVVGGAADTVGPEFDAKIGDKIAVNAIDVDGDGDTAEQEFTFLGEAATNPFTAPGQISWFNNVPGNETFILLNTDTDTEHDGVIRVLGVHTVDANWFQL